MQAAQNGLTQVLAWIGALTGTGALLWDFYKWKTSGPQLQMTVSPNMGLATPGVGVDKTPHIAINVTNTGTARTTLKTIGVACYSSLWKQWRQKPAKNFVVVDTGPYCRPLPHILEIGEEWRPVLDQGTLLNRIEDESRVFFQLLHSASKKAISTRLRCPLTSRPVRD